MNINSPLRSKSLSNKCDCYPKHSNHDSSQANRVFGCNAFAINNGQASSSPTLTITLTFNTFSITERRRNKANRFYEDTSRKCCQDNPTRDKYSYRLFSHRVIGISYFRPLTYEWKYCTSKHIHISVLITSSQESPSLQIAHGKFLFAWVLCMPHPIQTFVLAVSPACTIPTAGLWHFPNPSAIGHADTKSLKYFHLKTRLPASTFRDIILSLMFYH